MVNVTVRRVDRTNDPGLDFSQHTRVEPIAKSSKLQSYEEKRDFQKTAEPRGDDGVRPSKTLRFVVQRHDATRLHYDLRLELDGVFKSWAVTKGPSLNPADKRLAVEVEDHPLGYGDFEGTIPKGQYGGGTVQLFDRGTWAPETDAPPGDSLDKGELKFVLDGERLKGSFVLVRMKGDKFGGKRTNWLLIKHRDAEARDSDDGGGMLAIDTSVASGRKMAAIAAGKGKAPAPFMLGKGKAPPPDAVWDSNKGLAKAERVAAGTDKAPPAKTKAKSVKAKGTSPKATPAETPATVAADMPAFVEPQFCRSVTTPPVRGQMAARDQVRRLPPPGADRRRTRASPDADGARLDREVSRRGESRLGPSRCDRRWRTGRLEPRRHA